MKISSLLFLSENVHFSKISAQEEKKEILPLLWRTFLGPKFMVSPRFRDFKLYFQETSIKELIMI